MATRKPSGSGLWVIPYINLRFDSDRHQQRPRAPGRFLNEKKTVESRGSSLQPPSHHTPLGAAKKCKVHGLGLPPQAGGAPSGLAHFRSHGLKSQAGVACSRKHGKYGGRGPERALRCGLHHSLHRSLVAQHALINRILPLL